MQSPVCRIGNKHLVSAISIVSQSGKYNNISDKNARINNFITRENKQYVTKIDINNSKKSIKKLTNNSLNLSEDGPLHPQIMEASWKQNYKQDFLDNSKSTKTISRKRILQKIKNENPTLDDILEERQVPDTSPSGFSSGTLGQIFDKIHISYQAENAYISITDSMYQSLQNTKNVSFKDDSNNDAGKRLCPVLSANLLASHAETYRHGGLSNCEDCRSYADSLRDVLPFLAPKIFGATELQVTKFSLT